MLNPKTGKRWKLFLGLPSNGTVSDFQVYILRELEDRYKDEIEFIWPDQLCHRIFHDAAREGVVQDFLDSKADVLWFLDSDVVPPRHVLDVIVEHGDKWQCAGAPYPVFMAQPGEAVRQIVFTVYQSITPHPVTGQPRIAPLPTIPTEGTAMVDGIATGCLFIKREVFDKLERPYFEFKYDPITRQPIEGEDIGFIIKMHRLGIKFFIDFSMACRHFKNNIDLIEMNNYAVSYAQKAVNWQHQAISKQVKELEEKYLAILEKNRRLAAALKQAQPNLPLQKAGKTPSQGRPLIFK